MPSGTTRRSERATIRSLRDGKREPGLDTLLKIAKALGTTPDGLLLDQQLPAGLAEPEDQFRPITRLRCDRRQSDG